MYGNIYRVGGIHITDVKYYVKDAMKVKSHDYKSSGYPFVSSEDDSFVILKKDLLGSMFPTPSSCESIVMPPIEEVNSARSNPLWF
jgi:hypothetical protein